MTNKIKWTKALQNAVYAISIEEQHKGSDLASRAAEIARNAILGRELTEAQIEFVQCFRQRFGFKQTLAQAAFENAWKLAWEGRPSR